MNAFADESTAVEVERAKSDQKKNSEGNSLFPFLIPKMIVCQFAMLTSPCLEYNHKNAVNEMKGDPVFVHTSVLEPPYHSQM
jgi:hypothetical protein